MLDRAAVKEFIDSEFDDSDMEIPNNVSRSDLVEAFCIYVEDDYYDWIKDNFNSFFNNGDIKWDWIRDRIKSLKEH